MSNKKKQIFLTIVVALLVVSISRLTSYVPGARLLQPAQTLFGLALIYWIMNPTVGKPGRVTVHWSGKAVIFLAILTLASVLFGISMGRAGKYFLETYSKVLLFFVVLTAALHTVHDLRKAVWGFFISVGLVAYVSLFVSGVSKTSSHAAYDANDTGLLLVTAFPLGIWLLGTAGKRGRLVVLAFLGMILATIPKTESRGTFLGFALVGVGLVLLSPGLNVGKRALILVAAVLATYVSAPDGYWDRVQSLSNPEEDYNWTAPNGRRQVALRGIGYMMDFPLFGIGINNFPMAEGQISDKARNAAAGTGIRWVAAHNSYVQAGSELGIPGLLTFATMTLGSAVSLALLRPRRRNKKEKLTPDQAFVRNGPMYLALAFLGYSSCAFFVSFAWHDTIYILVAFSLALREAWTAEARSARTPLLVSAPGARRSGVHGPAQPTYARLSGAASGVLHR